MIRFFHTSLKQYTLVTLMACMGGFWGTQEVCAGSIGDQFDESITVNGHRLSLNGVGTLKYKWVISVYDAAFYTGENGAKRIEVVYRVGTEAKRFNEVGIDILNRNFSPDELAPFVQNIETMNSWYPNPEKGDRCSITFLPGKGTTLVYNGKSLGSIEGNDFADVYFSIWLGDDPASTNLRDALLTTGTEIKRKSS